MSFRPEAGKHAQLVYTPNFRPTEIGDAALWFDASDTTTLSLNFNAELGVTQVLSWTDKIKGYTFNAGPTDRPLYSSSFNTSYPTVVFNGINSLLQGSGLFGGFTTNACSVFFIGNASGLPRDNAPFLTATRVDDTTQIFFKMGIDSETGGWFSEFDMATNGAVKNYTDATLPCVGNFNVESGTTNPCSLSINQLTGTPSTRDGAYALGGSYNMYLGGFKGGETSIYFPGNISEILLYSKSLSLEEQNKVSAYLGQKWGLKSSLQSPYTVTQVYYPVTSGPSFTFVKR